MEKNNGIEFVILHFHLALSAATTSTAHHFCHDLNVMQQVITTKLGAALLAFLPRHSRSRPRSYRRTHSLVCLDSEELTE